MEIDDVSALSRAGRVIEIIQFSETQSTESMRLPSRKQLTIHCYLFDVSTFHIILDPFLVEESIPLTCHIQAVPLTMVEILMMDYATRSRQIVLPLSFPVT